jgi:hypothetical protein
LHSEILFTPAIFCNSQFPLYIHTLYFCIRIFFFKSTLFLYSEIPFSFPLYSCIREFHFHRYIIVFRNPFIHFPYFLFGNSCLPWLLAYCSALHQHIDDNSRALMSLCRTCVGLIYIFCQIYTQEKKFQKLFSSFVFASVVLRCWNVVREQILGSALGNCIV